MKIAEIIKFSILCLAVVLTFSLARFSLLDELLLIYLGAAFLFEWGGGFVLGSGLIMELLVVLSRYDNRHDLSVIAPYPVWLMGGGVFLLLLPWIKNVVTVWRQNKHQVRGFLKHFQYEGWKSIKRLSHVFLETVQVSSQRLYCFLWGVMRTLYQRWFGRFSLVVRCKIILIAITLPVLFVSTSWPVDSIFLTVGCLGLLLFVRDSRIPVAAAGISFIAAAGFVAIQQRPFADPLIQYGYYFLWMIVAIEIKRLIMQYTRSRQRGA